MTTERILQVCVTAMAALATLMLGTSQESTSLPVIAVLVSATSLIFTDMLGWFHLHRYVAGVAGTIAGINAFVQSQTGGLETQFISVANLLIHLQIILLFQKKTTRLYWQLITLSLLQVVVAAALNLFVLFGPLLVLYTGFAISAMLVFFIYRETLPFFSGDSNDGKADEVIVLQSAQPTMDAYHRLRRPRRILFRTSYARNFLMLAVSTVVVATLVFLLMPRFGDGVWRAKSSGSKTGPSEELDLSEVDSIYESPTMVMRISFIDEATGLPYMASGYPYFRGKVLERYRRGVWKRLGAELEKKYMFELNAPTRIYSAVRQKVHLESSRERTVSTVAPACSLTDTPDAMRIEPRTMEVMYFPEEDDDPVDYSVGTTGFRNGLQSEFIPMVESMDSISSRIMSDWNRTAALIPSITGKAAEIVGNIPEENVLDRARKLESHFTDGLEGYKYSLDPSPNRNPNVDPVEDFVMNHKTGHCQFYASALALMLRSQGIPARIVTGYRADTYNVVGNYYQIREMDAHAWVEAAIPYDEVPRDEVLPSEGLGDAELGAWVRLDPTPGDNWVSQSVAVSPWRQKITDTVDYLQLLWSEYVLGLNEKRQRKAIYEPIKNAVKNAVALVFSRDVWAARLESLRNRFQGDFFTQQNVRDGAIAVVALTAAFYLCKFLAKWIWRFATGRWQRKSKRLTPQVEFYRKLESLLAQHGIQRGSSQTQQEFAELAGHRLKKLEIEPNVADLPAKIVDFFYQIRFGQGRLDNADVQRLENWLGTLQQSLTK